MLTFVVSMRARALSKSWEYHCALLERTVASLVAQTHPAFDVVIVCHDVPAIAQAGHPAVHMAPVAFAPPERSNDAMCADKALKIAAGITWARSRGSEYVMFVDADDLVSRRLSAFAAGQPGRPGWFVEDGYVLRYGDRWMKAHAPHHLICGTGTIVSTSLLNIDGIERDAERLFALLDHHEVARYLEQRGHPLAPLPFPGAIYVLHPDSTSEVPGGAGHRGGGVFRARPAWRRALGRARDGLRVLPTMRMITPALRTEFSIPDAPPLES